MSAARSTQQKALTDERLADRRRDRAHEQEHAHDERAHVLRRLGERVLEAGDARKDLRDGDEDVAAGLDPDVEVGCDWVFVGVGAGGDLVAAWVTLVLVFFKKKWPTLLIMMEVWV